MPEQKRVAELPVQWLSAYRASPAAFRFLELAPIAIILVLTVALLHLPLSPDVSWQLWIAHHIRQGARLYSDIMEVNPPLWFWMAVPVDWIAERICIDTGRVLIAATGLATLLSILATDRLLAPIARPRRTIILGYAAAMLMLMSLADMEQREHLVLIAALPYAALAAARRERRPVPLILAFAVGVGAALGFALKHYFLAVPLLLELWLTLGLRRGWRPLRPETIALALTGIAYGVAILAFTPEFLTVMVPLLRLAYGATGMNSLLSLFRSAQLIWLLTLWLIVKQRRSFAEDMEPFAIALLVAAAGFGTAWLIQHKGWPYQAIPTSGCLTLALLAMFTRLRDRLPSAARAAGIVLLALPIMLGVLRGGYRDPFAATTAPVIAGLHDGDSVAFVSTEPALAWPLTRKRGFRYPTRYYGFWMIYAILANERSGGHDPRLVALGRAIAAQTARDFACARAERIAFEPAGPSFDIHAFFMRDPDFTRLLGHYALARRTDSFDIYQRQYPFPAPPAVECRHGV